MPTSVVVTILVATLSVWLAPALTRQWDDRQRARELQGGVAAQIDAASGDVVGELLALADGSSSMRDLDVARKRWLVARYGVSAQLETYFSERTQNQWELQGDVVDTLFAVVQVMLDPQSGIDPQPGRRNAVPRIRRYAVAQAIHSYADAYENEREPNTAAYEPPENYSRKGLGGFIVANASDFVIGSAANVTEDIGQDHPQGFSTTRGDLFHDLLP